MRVIVFLIVVLAVAACSTKYQDMGFSGGVAAQQMTANTFRIVARGNGYTSSNTVKDYMVLKAAETTKQMGGTHFLVVSAGDASRTNYVATAGHARTTVVGNTAHTSYTPGSVYGIFKPGQDAFIRVLAVPNGSTPPPGAISADEIIQFVGARVRRG
jgi:hypothetical protein